MTPACGHRTDVPNEAEAGRNLGHSFAAASFGADDSLELDCCEDEEEQELVQIPFHISVYKGGKAVSYTHLTLPTICSV